VKSKVVKLRRAGPNDFAEVAEMHYPPRRKSLNRSGWSMWVAEEAQGLGVGLRLLNKAARSNPSGDVICGAQRRPTKRDNSTRTIAFNLMAAAFCGRRCPARVWPTWGIDVIHQGPNAERRPQASMTTRSAFARDTHTSISSSPTAVRPR
jgi:GNAT superfamily N-acetyltransferase